MNTYFIKDENNECGPFTIEQLKLKGINKTTPVWHAAFKDWRRAENIFELKELFETRSPSFSFAKNKLKKIWESNFLKQQNKKAS